MATATISTEKVEFDDQLSQIRTEIEAYFKLLVDSLKERERQLLSELEEIASSHKREKDQQKQSLSEIQIMLKQTQENIHSNILRETQVGIVKLLEQQQREIESKLNCRRILFDPDDTLLDKIKYLGNINIMVDACQDSSLPFVDDTDEARPVVDVGSIEGLFSYAWGVSVDYATDNIYVSGGSNSGVQVFDREGKYLFKFGDIDGVGEMNSTRCIAISKDYVFVTESQTGSLLVYDLNGNFIIQDCQKEGHNKGLSEPFGIAIDDVTGDIYVCDSTDDCVKIFTNYFSYKSEFGKGITFLRDVKLSANKIYVLSNNFPYFYIFNYNLIEVDHGISHSISKHLSAPNSFVMDETGNFIFPSYRYHNILIFDKEGNLIHKITESIPYPLAVTLDSMGQIIVVCQNDRLLTLNFRNI